MKLKNLTTDDNKLKKFEDFFDNINLTDYEAVNGEIFYGNYKKDNITFYSDNTIETETFADNLKKILSKYWSHFEEGIEFHAHFNNYFVEVKQKRDDANIWEFIIEANDDSLYFKFNTNFVINL